MSATTTTRTFDVSGSRPVPFTRHVGVELRKMTDTRAGVVMLSIVALITLGVIVLFFFGSRETPETRTFINFFEATNTPQMLLLPVLAILLVTQEWGQRTTLTTFALEPSRAKIVMAKRVAALIFGLLALVVAGVISGVFTLVGGAADPWQDFSVQRVVNVTMLQMLAVLQGVAFGLMLLNSAGAIVLFFALPVVVNLLSSFWNWFAEKAAWLDLATAQAPLYGYDTMTGERIDAVLDSEQWIQLGTTGLIWIVLPFVIGLWRVVRSEAK